METKDLSEARIYVSTYGKYNEGSLKGKWIDLSSCYDHDEFMEVCHELHQDEEEPELMFQDWENIPEELIDEGHLDSNFFELRDELEKLDGMNVSAFWIWLENTGKDLTTSVYFLMKQFHSAFVGRYVSKEDFAREMVGMEHELSEFAERYFDYDKYADELFDEGYWFESGYVFRDE
ncbi:antirestriction protein ArdA [Bacteroides propionicifaciens]|uniref:antirestriction protein ArdA n=1 Tax=Bacteroides propionicifaciens TaxID=392838 RepID=UPI000364ADC6|nr:antirestriction protein ArdA [Bacteroides propionicifaciens]